MNDCIFCKIARGEIKPAGTLLENEKAMAFLDVKPRSPGHTLVIPKIHAGTLTDLEDSFVGPVFEAVREITARIKRTLDAESFSIGINDGPAAGQEVAHLHVHIMPRFAGDGGRPIQSLVDNSPRETLEVIAQKILTNA